jgi:hypothetical protein
MGRISFSDAVGQLNKWLPRIILVFLALTIVTGLGSAILTAYFGVPIGDDYLAIKTFSDKHTWLAEAWNALTHTGRYMQSITSSLGYGIFRGKSPTILPLIVMAWFFLLAYLYTRLGARKLKVPATTSNISALSAAILFLLLSYGQPTDPHNIWFFFQPFFFTSAIVTYTIGLLLYLTFLLVLLSSKKVSKLPDLKYWGLIFIVTYILGLYNETSPATIFALSVIVFIAGVLKDWRNKRTLYALLSTVAASLCALITMYISPAVQARRHSIGAPKASLGDMITGVVHNLQASLHFLFTPSDIIILISLGATISILLIPKITSLRKMHLHMLIFGLFGVASGVISLVISLTLVAIGYGIGPNIYPRTLLIPEILLVVGLLLLSVSVWSLVVRYTTRKPCIMTLLLLCSLLGMVFATAHSISRTAGHLVGVQDYNATWHQQDIELQQWAHVSPNKTIYLDDRGAGISDGFSTKCIGPNVKSTSWLSEGMESYYGVKHICAKSDLSTKQ